MDAVTFLIAVAIGVAVWRLTSAAIRMASTAPPEVDPEDVVAVNQDYRCSVCGAEVTLRAANVAEMKPPRHCREDMEPIASV